MRKTFLTLIILGALSIQHLISQEENIKYKKDPRPQRLKEDYRDQYKSNQITTLDLLQALALSGIRIDKIPIGPFDKKYNLFIVVDEYKDGQIIKTENLNFDTNRYYFKIGKGDKYYTDYIDQIKIITRIEDTTFIAQLGSYAMFVQKKLIIKKYDKDAFYTLMPYTPIKWSIDEKNPLLACVSSWKDGRHQRLCGVGDLTKNSEASANLLKTSPHYYIISYLVKDINK
ncbi:MAG: hypothetical protein PHT07_22965 [Paludibacter sp.]|nr:hypothetical protein [Paludibacter sp.]